MEERRNEKEQKTTKPIDINEFKRKFPTIDVNVVVEKIRFQANQCFLESDFDGAIKYYSFCIELNSCPLALKCRAMSYIRLKRYEDAINDYNILINVNSDDTDAIFRYCYCLIQLDKLEEAAVFFESSFKLRPDCVEKVPELKNLKQYIESQKLIKKNEEVTSSDSSAKVTDPFLVPNIKHENVSLVNTKDNHIDLEKEKKIQAEKKEERRLKRKQTTTKYLKMEEYKSKLSNNEIDLIIDDMLFKGNECFKFGNYDDALRYYDFCIELNLCPRALNYRAIIHFMLDRFEDAINDYDILISRNNKDAISMFRLCYCLIKLENFEEAANYLNRAWKLRSDYEEIIPIFKESKYYIESVKLKFDTVEGTLIDALKKVNEEKMYADQINLYYTNLLTCSNNNLNNSANNNNICFCERGPGPSSSFIPFPHVKEDYCIQNESNKILPSSSETHCKPRNINLTLSNKTTSNEASILNSQESKNNKQNKEKSTCSCPMTNILEIDVKETLNDQSNTTESNILVKQENKRINNCNNYNVNENEYNSLPKRICTNNKYDDDQMYQKENDTFKDNNDISSPHKFIYLWQTLKTSDHNLQLRAQILRSIKLDNLKTIIGNKLDGHMLRIILRCLRKYFCIPEDCELLVCYLKIISQLNRFLIAKKFLCNNDKSVLSYIFKFLEDQGCKEISLLREIYT